MAIYLSNADYIDPRSHEIRSTGIRVQEGVGAGIELVESNTAGDPEIDCTGRIVTKSFAVGHHHIYSALARGMPAPDSPPRNFVEILEKIWWRVDKALDTDMIRASAIAAGIDAAKSGSTFIIDHHASPNAATDSLHVIAGALESIGLSHLLCYELSDRDGLDRLEAGLAETDRYLQSHQGLVGLHASFTVSDNLLARSVEMAQAHGTGVHIHVAEAESDEADSLKKHAKRVVHRLSDAGALDSPQTILAHCIHLDNTERELINASKAWIAHQSESNQNNAVGCLDASAFPERVIIGTDGMHGDCLAATRAAYLASQGVDNLSPADACARLRRVHDYLSQNNLAGDTDNNLVILDYQSPTPITQSNWAGHMMYGLNRSHVESVISNGRVIVREGICTLIDEESLLAEARIQAQRLWDKL